MTDGLVVVTDPVVHDLSTIQNVLRGFTVTSLSSEVTDSDRIALLAKADAIVVNIVKIDAALVRSLNQCKVISRLGVGTDNVDVECCSRAGIYVSTVVDYCIDEVSDHVLCLLLSLVRKIQIADTSVRNGQWSIACVQPIRRLKGKCIGLLGCGRIGRALVPKLKSIGLNILVYDPYAVRSEQIPDVDFVDFDTLLHNSDFLSIHAPATMETRNLLNSKAFARMRQGALIVNTARGSIIDEEALLQALDSGLIAGAALDVVRNEPIGATSPWLCRQNVILTPHMAFYSEEALLDLQVKAAEEVRRVLTGNQPASAVNLKDVRRLTAS